MKHSIRVSVMASAILAGVLYLAAPGGPTLAQAQAHGNPLNLEVALRIIAAGERQAVAISKPMNIAVLDKGGHLIAFHRMDDALLGSIDISINKAYTSCMFKAPTAGLGAAAQPGGPLFGIHTTNDSRIVIFGGGLPLTNAAGNVIGAVGVSGGSVEQDVSVVTAAAGAF